MDKNHGSYKATGKGVTLTNGHKMFVGNLEPSKDNTPEALKYTVGVKMLKPDSEIEGELIETKFALTTEAAYTLMMLLMYNENVRQYAIEHSQN